MISIFVFWYVFERNAKCHAVSGKWEIQYYPPNNEIVMTQQTLLLIEIATLMGFVLVTNKS